MYTDHFRLTEAPFSIAPDPRFLFMTDRHREAMAHLLYGVQGAGGIVLLTGEIGAGKTTICRSLFEQLPDTINVAFILNPRMNVLELLQTICEELHISIELPAQGTKYFIDAINTKLLTEHSLGHRTILIVDEAQNLDASVLEQLRLLTNLETNTQKLLQIFLIGQPELLSLLAQPEMRQVSQRIVARYHLDTLNQFEVNGYIAHRMHVAGAAPLTFPKALGNQIYRASQGVPRLINLICDRSLLGTYVAGNQQVTPQILRQAIREVITVMPTKSQHRWKLLIGISSIIIATLLLLPLTQTNNTTQSVAKQTQPIPTIALPSLPAKSSEANPIQASIAPPMTLKWPSDIPLSDSETIAFKSLLKIYGLSPDLQSNHSACQLAAVNNFRCYIGLGGVSELFSIDQPVLIRLTTEDEKPYAAVLIAINHQVATLDVGGKIQQISLSSLVHAWKGKFILLWNPPQGFYTQIVLNQRSPAVQWIRTALEKVDGIRDNRLDIYDETLEQRIKAFQLIEGIQPDGVIGSQTLIHLKIRNHQGLLPHLVTEQKG